MLVNNCMSKPVMFAINIEKCDYITIIDVIIKCTRPGFIVFTGGGKSPMNVCKERKLPHKVVNYSLHFTDLIPEVRTDTVEGRNNVFKHDITVRNRTRKM